MAPKNTGENAGPMHEQGEMYNQQEDESENSEEVINKANQNQNGVIILGLNVHCLACEGRILKSLRGFDGVEGIEIDSKNDKVTIKGNKITDPIKVAERVKKKTGKHVELISPKNPKKQEKKEEKKKEPQVTEVLLKIYLHCPSCAKKVKKEIHKIPGVLTVQPDLEKNIVTVKGGIEAEKLMEIVKKKTGKHAEIVKKGTNQGGEHKDDQNDPKKQGNEQQKDFYTNYPPELVYYAPQLFSDENPNSCFIM